MHMQGIKTFEERYAQDITDELFFGFPKESIVQAEEKLHDPTARSVAYFSMEFGLAPSIYHQFQTAQATSGENMFTCHRVFSNLRAMDLYHQIQIDKVLDIPIYSGGLGVLAGDTLKSAADHKLSVAAVGILWNKGYFKQNFWFESGQIPDETRWDPYTYAGLIPLDRIIEIKLQKENIFLRLWKYYVYSFDLKGVIPLILLDSDIEENGDASDIKRHLTDQLYRSDNAWWKIVQRSILGIGGMVALRELGYAIDLYHLNEGHAAFAFVEKVKDLKIEEWDSLSKQFAYTCHTPVEAGHDRFAMDELKKVLHEDYINVVRHSGMDTKHKNVVNLTQLAMNTATYVNAVAKKHGEVTRIQFPEFKEKIKTITNGIHTYTWVSESISELLNRNKETIGDWEKDATLLDNVMKLKSNYDFRRELWEAHMINKGELAKVLNAWLFDERTFTIAWARRLANYKRPSLILRDVDRLLGIAKELGPIQIVIAGKAHPNDNLGHTFINEMLQRIDSLNQERDYIRIYMLENYDTYFGKLLTSSVDVWLNNPLPPFEASGTSGMKAILNGVLQLSTVDGWIVEAQDKNIGRFFGYQPVAGEIGSEDDLHMDDDAEKLYVKLTELLKIYHKTIQYGEPHLDSEWIDMMINCIAISGYFSTHRMVKEYNDMIWNM